MGEGTIGKEVWSNEGGRAVTSATINRFLMAVRCCDRVSGLTHNFYRYPARFSPVFARSAIEAFTSPGDMVLDPFMGGATTLVEACALKRQAVGVDLNSLSVFVAKVKTTLMSEHDLAEVRAWAEVVATCSNLHDDVERDSEWISRGYQKNISDRRTWPIRKLLEFCIVSLDLLSTQHQRRFARCILLRTAQWALDCRRHIPRAWEFRNQILDYTDEMIAGAREFSVAVGGIGRVSQRGLALCLHRSSEGLESEQALIQAGPPRLILTSPPYPGVHVLYHRWQVRGRRETPAPYWIAASLGGDGASFYTFGDRKQQGLSSYFEGVFRTFSSLAKIADRRTIVVQMIAFAEPNWQLPKYLATMSKAGFREVFLRGWANSADGRFWREIPNRKFYADQRGPTTSSKEVVLVHQRM